MSAFRNLDLRFYGCLFLWLNNSFYLGGQNAINPTHPPFGQNLINSYSGRPPAPPPPHLPPQHPLTPPRLPPDENTIGGSSAPPFSYRKIVTIYWMT